MSSKGTSAEVGGAGQGAAEYAPQAAAYGFFSLAGFAVASAAWILLDDLPHYLQVLQAPSQPMFWLVLLPGVAAALGAAAVHRPFMRAVRAGRGSYAHGWAAVGVVAAHVAYAALVFVAVLGSQALMQSPAPWSTDALGEAQEYAMIAGVISLIVGFLPNVLVAHAFAGFVLARRASSRRAGSKRGGSRLAGELSLSKGAGHASSVPAE